MNNSNNHNQDMRHNPHLWEIRAVRDFFWMIAIIFILWLGYYLRSIFTPVLIALVLAYLVNPLVNWLEDNTKLNRLMVIIIILLILSLILIIVMPITIFQILALIKSVPERIDKIITPQFFADIAKSVGLTKEDDVSAIIANYEGFEAIITQLREWATSLQEDPMQFIQPALEGASKAFGVIGDFISATTYIIIVLILIPLYFVFFSWKFNSIVLCCEPYIPKSHREEIIRVVKKMDLAVSNFFRGRVVIALIQGVMFSFGWWLVGVPYWLPLGMITGLLNILPYVSAIGWPFAILFMYLEVMGGNLAEANSAINTAVNSIQQTGNGSAGSLIAGATEAINNATPGSTISSATEVIRNATQSAEGTNGENGYLSFFMTVVFWPSFVYVFVQLIEGWFLTPYIQGKELNLHPVTIIIVIFIGGALGGLYGLLLCIPLAACLKILLLEVILPRLIKWAEHS